MVSTVEESAELPLAGMRVIDLTRYVSGAYATMQLAALGADVVKLENPQGGDPYRGQGTGLDANSSSLFCGLNAGKRSVAIDLGRPEGRALVSDLIAGADFLVENARPGSLTKLGLDFESVHRRWPHVIYVSISGYGSRGPSSGLGGFDLILQAESGIMGVTGEAGGPPTKVGAPVLDIGSGLAAVTGALAALQVRHRTGVGCHTTSSLLGFGIASFASILPTAIATGRYPTPLGSHSPSFAPYGAFRTRDGYIVLAGAGNERLWEGLVACLGLAELLEDPRFATNAGRVAHREALTLSLERVLSEHGTDHWLEVLGGQGIPVASVRSLSEVVAWDQVSAMKWLQELPLDDADETHYAVTPPFTLSGALRYDCPAPRLGQHTAEVLLELGLSEDEFRYLADTGTVGADSHA